MLHYKSIKITCSEALRINLQHDLDSSKQNKPIKSWTPFKMTLFSLQQLSFFMLGYVQAHIHLRSNPSPRPQFSVELSRCQWQISSDVWKQNDTHRSLPDNMVLEKLDSNEDIRVLCETKFCWSHFNMLVYTLNN